MYKANEKRCMIWWEDMEKCMRQNEKLHILESIWNNNSFNFVIWCWNSLKCLKPFKCSCTPLSLVRNHSVKIKCSFIHNKLSNKNNRYCKLTLKINSNTCILFVNDEQVVKQT